jgi:hypothetical protein
LVFLTEDLEPGGPNAINNAISFAKFCSRSHDAVISVYDDAGNVIQTHEHASNVKELRCLAIPDPEVDS